MLGKTRRTTGFTKAEFRESAEKFYNPGCGWYHIYTLNAMPPKNNISLGEEIWFYDNAHSERLALALIDISAFRSGAISDTALLRIDRIIQFFHNADKQVLLRFVYDTDGNCIAKEPLALSVVKRHMEQTGEIIKARSDDILVLQGLFIGNWGEMHGSKFSDDASVCELADTCYQCTGGKCFIALRTPAFLRAVLGGKNAASGLREKLALYNDAMFSSPTDMGTYGPFSRKQAGETGKWNRAEEIQWQNTELAFAPNGGEAVAHDRPIGCKAAANEMSRTHITYLNSIYQREQLDFWKTEIVRETDGTETNGYDYIGNRLGYRFVVRDAAIGRGQEPVVKIENIGFANLCREAECVCEIVGEDGSIELKILDADPREWMSGKTAIISTGISLKEKRREKGRVYLSLRQKADGKAIRFANIGADERLKIGELTNIK